MKALSLIKKALKHLAPIIEISRQSEEIREMLNPEPVYTLKTTTTFELINPKKS